jgi:outer membrane protein TolC
MIQQETDLLNADAALRTLINDPNLLMNRCQELITVQPPLHEPSHICVQESLITALHYRPEINAIREELKAACVRQDVAKNELRPVLNLILTSYVSGLEGDVNIGQALDDQFTLGRPTYSTGMVFEYPLGNRTAKAKMHKQLMEYSKWTYQLAKTTSDVRLEVETAIRDIDTSYRETICQAHAVVANQREIDLLEPRRDSPIDERTKSFILEDLLNAYDRLARSEALYATYLVDYNAGFAKLNKATGTLINCELFKQANSSPPPNQPPQMQPPLPPSEADMNVARSLAAPKKAGNTGAPIRR